MPSIHSCKKAIITSYILLVCIGSLAAQSKYANTWILGYTNNALGLPSNGYYGGMELNFTQDSVQIKPIDIFTYTPNGVANDENGVLQFYTNGCTIFNKEHQPMDNGSNINGSDYTLCEDLNLPGDYAVKCGTIVLPIPERKGYYSVVNLQVGEGTNYYAKLVSAEVDMNANNGLGKVIRKNETLIEDSLVDALAAVRHANGRDWWIVVPRGTNRSFWKVLVSPRGVHVTELEALPPPYSLFTLTTLSEMQVPPYDDVEVLIDEYRFELGNTQGTFSPDGRYYFRYVTEQEIEIYGFDRCNAQMNLMRLIPVEPYSTKKYTYAPGVGLAVSPNSKYLYFHNANGMYQVDISEDSLLSAQPVLIDTFDGFYQDISVFLAVFFQMRNAPDGKIYINCGNGIRVLHVINRPNERGVQCDFRQHSFELPRWNGWTFNYFPNFDLGVDLTRVCPTPPAVDTQGVNRFMLSPNPGSDIVSLSLAYPSEEPLKISIYDAIGRLITTSTRPSGTKEQEWLVTNWPSGNYLVQLQIGDGKTTTIKLSVVH